LGNAFELGDHNYSIVWLLKLHTTQACFQHIVTLVFWL